VLLSAATPSRLLDAFPPGVAVLRLPLDEAVARISSRLSSVTAFGHHPEKDRISETE
jgi:ATP-dependent DNA helicase DinG